MQCANFLCYKILNMQEAILQQSYQSLVIENQKLHSKLSEQEEQISALQSKLDWFIKQTFDKKSEKFYPDNFVECLPLFSQEELGEPTEPKEEKSNVKAHSRNTRGKTNQLGDNTDSGLRFDDGVEIIVEDIYPEEIEGLSADEYEIIGQEFSDRLASRESKTVVHRRVFHKAKLKSPSQIVKAAVPAQVLDGIYFSVSFLVEMIVDKCLYSLPLYRQHQRLSYEGFHLSRGTLITNFNRCCSQLFPIVEALGFSVLLSRILAIDETPMKVGVDSAKHKMKRGYVWPIYGDKDEIVYNYRRSRGAVVLGELLANFIGTVLSDGYSAYKSYVEGQKKAGFSDSVLQASCWVHARRAFVRLEDKRPEEYTKAIEFIGKLYKIEKEVDSNKYSDVLIARQKHSLPVVDDYFTWLRSFNGKPVIATNSLLRNAINYSLEREDSLRLFLKKPELQLDTNHLEREIRPIAIGRKNWMFCWTELGAENLCAAQSLIRTCLLHGINPKVYLIDVLQRICLERKKGDDVSDLIPRIWKEQYANNPLKCPSAKIIDH